MNQSGNSSLDREASPDPDREPNAVEVLGSIISSIGRLFSNIKNWITSGVGMLAVLSLVMAGAGGSAVHFIEGWSFSDSGSSNSKVMGIIEDATITKVYNKAPPGGQDQYMVNAEFPDPKENANCDKQCADARSRVTQGGSDCKEGECRAQFKNIDQDEKYDSGRVQDFCESAHEDKRPVRLVVSGSRNYEESEYANIILVEYVTSEQ